MKLVQGFTTRYKINQLVYFESTGSIEAAIAREKQIKGWVRSKKVALINSMNPQWRDLSLGWYDEDVILREKSERRISSF
jgi:putative endonuclease